jgi:hypothetical protein
MRMAVLFAFVTPRNKSNLYFWHQKTQTKNKLKLQKELYLYGSNRLGYITLELEIQNPTSLAPGLPSPGSQFFSVSGLKNYELTNHLGNVLSVVSDDAPVSSQADLVCSNDYFPFGSQMLERAFSSGVYRFGFNTQERTDEIAGVGNHNTALFWEYDTRLGRRWNLDPEDQISFSNYSCLGLNPNLNNDIKGNKWKTTEGKDSDKSKADETRIDLREKSKAYKQEMIKYEREYLMEVDRAGADAENSTAVKKSFEKFHDAQRGYEHMENSLTELDEMEKDELVTFTFDDMGPVPTSGNKNDQTISWSGNGWGNDNLAEERLITIHYYSRMGNGFLTKSRMVHEIKHAYQVLRRQMYPAIGKTNTDFIQNCSVVRMEIDAHHRQYFFDKKTFPSIKHHMQITKEYILSTDKDGQYDFPENDNGQCVD